MQQHLVISAGTAASGESAGCGTTVLPYSPAIAQSCPWAGKPMGTVLYGKVYQIPPASERSEVDGDGDHQQDKGRNHSSEDIHVTV